MNPWLAAGALIQRSLSTPKSFAKNDKKRHKPLFNQLLTVIISCDK